MAAIDPAAIAPATGAHAPSHPDAETDPQPREQAHVSQAGRHVVVVVAEAARQPGQTGELAVHVVDEHRQHEEAAAQSGPARVARGHQPGRHQGGEEPEGRERRWG